MPSTQNTSIGSGFWNIVRWHLHKVDFPSFEDEQISVLQEAGIVAARRWNADYLRAVCAAARLDPFSESTAIFRTEILQKFTSLKSAQIVNCVIEGAESILEENDDLPSGPAR